MSDKLSKRQIINVGSELLRALSEVDKDLTVHNALVLLEIAKSDDGLASAELEDILDSTSSSALSRTFIRYDEGRKDAKFKLFKVFLDSENMRIKRRTLNAKGAEVFESVVTRVNKVLGFKP